MYKRQANCAGLCADHMGRMEALYDEFVAVLGPVHPEGFAKMPADFKKVSAVGTIWIGIYILAQIIRCVMYRTLKGRV